MTKTNNNKATGVNQLTPEQEQMRMQVVDLELKARYWKAQFEIRDFTLRAEAIQPEYDKYLQDQKQKQEEMMKRFEEQISIANLQAEQGVVEVTELPS